LKAKEILDPRPYAVGSIKATFKKYKHLGPLLPAMGYSKEQIRELEVTINSTPCEVVVIGTPIDLRHVVNMNKPAVRVTYELQEVSKPDLKDIIRARLPKR